MSLGFRFHVQSRVMGANSEIRSHSREMSELPGRSQYLFGVCCWSPGSLTVKVVCFPVCPGDKIRYRWKTPVGWGENVGGAFCMRIPTPHAAVCHPSSPLILQPSWFMAGCRFGIVRTHVQIPSCVLHAFPLRACSSIPTASVCPSTHIIIFRVLILCNCCYVPSM